MYTLTFCWKGINKSIQYFLFFLYGFKKQLSGNVFALLPLSHFFSAFKFCIVEYGAGRRKGGVISGMGGQEWRARNDHFTQVIIPVSATDWFPLLSVWAGLCADVWLGCGLFRFQMCFLGMTSIPPLHCVSLVPGMSACCHVQTSRLRTQFTLSPYSPSGVYDPKPSTLHTFIIS